MSAFDAHVARWLGWGGADAPPAPVTPVEAEERWYRPAGEVVPNTAYEKTRDVVADEEAAVLERLVTLTADLGPWEACKTLFDPINERT